MRGFGLLQGNVLLIVVSNRCDYLVSIECTTLITLRIGSDYSCRIISI